MVLTAAISLLATSIAFASAQNCHDYVVLSARGTLEKQGPSVGFVGMINTTLNTLSNGIEYDVIYPATFNLTGAVVGVADVIRYINEGVQSCPSQKYALLGYSQGAEVVDIALHNFTDPSSATYKAIKAVLVIGNPGRVANETANVDELGGDSNRNISGPYTLGGQGTIPTQFYNDSKVLDICYQGDHVCAPINGSIGITTPHLLYAGDQNVQSMGARFLISKLGGNTTFTPGNGTTSGSSSSSTILPTTSATGSAVVSTTSSATKSATNSASVAVSTGAAVPLLGPNASNLACLAAVFVAILLPVLSSITGAPLMRLQ